MKRARLILGGVLLLICCNTLAVLNADEPVRRWKTRFGGVLTGMWDRSLDEPDGSLIRIRSQSNLYRVRVDDLSSEDRWYVLSQRIADAEEPEKTSSTQNFRQSGSAESDSPSEPKPLPSDTGGAENTAAPVPNDNSDWGISASGPQDPGTISTDDSLDAEFIPVPDSPSAEETGSAAEESNQLSEEHIETPSEEEPPQPPDVPGKEAGERRVYKIAGVSYPFRWCPAGSFTMGSPQNESGRSDNEAAHEVTLTRGFWILETEVTQEMWTSVFDWNPSWFSNTGTGAPRIKHIETGTLPVEQVTWEETADFCKAIEKISGWHVLLPTEAEWEYACRAGTSTPYSFGDEIEPEDANYDDSEPGNIAQKRRAVRNPYPVAGFPPNPWGICDMHGNVAEWCRDRYGDLETESVTDPIGPEQGNSRVFRGGAWFLDSSCCRSAYRYGLDPDTRAYYLGFRIVLEP